MATETCVNCPREAVYFVTDPGADPIEFCSVCLPSSYAGRAVAGQFSRVEVDGQLELPFEDGDE
jgi:hypothetical protein